MPRHLRYQNSCDHDVDNVTFLALVRWLVPHPLARERDSKHRPVCPPPFDLNHALWKFAQRSQRNVWHGHGRAVSRQLHMFPGKTDTTRRTNAGKLSTAFYDLVHVDSIQEIMNCTYVDNDTEAIMQTVTLPFQGSQR